MSISIPSAWSDKAVAGSVLLEDPRVDQLFFAVAVAWTKDNINLATDRSPGIRSSFAEWEFREGVKLHARRAIKALRAGKPMPEKPTKRQQESLVREEDLPELNRLFRETLSQHILDTAQAINDCVVMFSDPARVAEILTF